MQSSVRDLGIRTIGWGSVATIAWIALLMAGCGQASAAAPAPTAYSSDDDDDASSIRDVDRGDSGRGDPGGDYQRPR